MSIIKNKFTHKDYPGIAIKYQVDLVKRTYKLVRRTNSERPKKYAFFNDESKLEQSIQITKCITLAQQEIAQIFKQFPAVKSKSDVAISSIFG